MTETDLELVDDDPRDAFDFSVDRWQRAARRRLLEDDARARLKAHMPDFDDLSEGQEAKGKGQGLAESKGLRQRGEDKGPGQKDEGKG